MSNALIARGPTATLAGGGESEMLLGNDAIVRGALEAGVAFATGYPGTPSSEVTDGFARLAAERGIAFEYAVNEKIALELAFATKQHRTHTAKSVDSAPGHRRSRSLACDKSTRRPTSAVKARLITQLRRRRRQIVAVLIAE